MRYASASIAVTLTAAITLGSATCLAEPLPSDTAPAVTGDTASQGYAWKHHHVRVDFMGFTSAYTCDGIEGKVRDILRYLGARKDVTVQAHGCPRGPNSLEHMIWLIIDFNALAPAPDGTAEADLVHAQWTPIKIDSQHPFFMGQGDCELLDALKAVVTTNFPARSFAYNTNCAPYQVSLIDFRIQGEVLKADREHAG